MAQRIDRDQAVSGFLSPELLLAAIVDSSDDAILSKDLQGIITSWNKGAERIFGYKESEMIGKPILCLLPPDRIEEETIILQRLRRGEQVQHFETVRLRKDGRLVDVSLTISPIRDGSGTIVGASKIARDITDRKLAIAKLAQAHGALRRANRMKAEFISTLSHELRTPLNAIAGWLQIFDDDASREDIAQGLEVIRRNVHAQTRLIDDLLDMSRIESGKLSLDVQRVDIASIITAAMDAVRPAADGRGVRLSSTFCGINGVIMGDRIRLQQVVWNLLTNAVKFSDNGGRVHVTAQRMDTHLEIAVADTGPGISADYLEGIFDRFSQADSSSTRRHNGLGLGLSIAKHLVELHGGKIEATSEGIGHGATFVVRLPLHAAQGGTDEEPAQPASKNESKELAGIKVLAVDDEVDSADIVRRILERAGASVRSANCMQEALWLFETFAPDVIVTDIGMPEHDGYELIGRIRAIPKGRRVAAVALTALARSEDRARALRSGFQMHVAKPVEGSELTAAVRNLATLQRP